MVSLSDVFVPPFWRQIFHRLVHPFYGIKGDFPNWQAAEYFLKNSGIPNYASDEVLKKVDESIAKVRRGEAEFERDGVCFSQKDYNGRLLSALWYVFMQFDTEKTVSVLDFGGSLGSTWFQNREILNKMNCCWHIVEQENFVRLGREKIPEIQFYYTIEEYLSTTNFPPDMTILLLSGVLQYLENPYEMLKAMLAYRFRYVLVDRTFFIPEKHDRLGIEYVPEEISKSAYPIWLFSEERWRSMMKEERYALLFGWKSFDRIPCQWKWWGGGSDVIQSQGFLLHAELS